MRIEYADKIIKTVRAKIQDKPGYFAKMVSVVEDQGGMLGQIKTIHIGKGNKTRDLDIYTAREEIFHEILGAIEAMDGIHILEVRDVVQEIHTGGKIEVMSRVEVETIDDLSVVYTPGVASICKLISEKQDLAKDFTSIPSNVAIVTNGTAILGLGDIGPVAGMPVMEGKALLFKLLAGINGYPILIKSRDPKTIIETVKNIAPTYGAIKLEDIKAPECFEIEDTLDEILDIPVLHDDQHGTAVVVLAALINIGRYASVNLEESSVGIIGLGAAGSGIFKLLKAFGITEVYGTDLNKEMERIFRKLGGTPTDLNGIMDKSKIVIATTGCPGLIKPEMIKKGQIILALSNPDPEIDPDAAVEAGAAFAADGRSVNNALAFPGLFKGALDAKARSVSCAMKIAAAKTIARLASEGDLVPNILDRSVHAAVAKAVEEASLKS